MISSETLNVINKYIDEYIDETRLDFIYLGHNRDISEISPGKFKITDSDVIIDKNRNYDEFLRHPVEDFFVPKTAEVFIVEYLLDLQLPELINLSDFEVLGISYEEEIPITDNRISDDSLKLLLNYTCFTPHYQKIYPELKPYLIDLYQQKHSPETQKFLDKIKPFLET